MIRFELRKLAGSEKFVHRVKTLYPNKECIYSQTEATHIVEQILFVLKELNLEYALSFDLLDDFEYGYRPDIALTVAKRRKDSDVLDGIGIVSFGLHYGESDGQVHNVLRSWARQQFSRVMVGVNKHQK